MVYFKGLNGLHVARLFSTLIHVCRMSPFMVERSNFSDFAKECIENHSLFLEYDEADIKAILSCFDEVDVNGVHLASKIEDLTLEEILGYIKEAFTHILNLNVVRENDLWEGYPLKQALELLMQKNPNFNLKELLELCNTGVENG